MPIENDPTDNSSTETGPVSQKQLADLEKRRARPQLLITYTPTGPVTEEVNREAADRVNADIDRESAHVRDRLGQQKDRAKRAFNMASRDADIEI